MIQFEEQELMLSKDFVERTIDLERGRSAVLSSPRSITTFQKNTVAGTLAAAFAPPRRCRRLVPAASLVRA